MWETGPKVFPRIWCMVLQELFGDLVEGWKCKGWGVSVGGGGHWHSWTAWADNIIVVKSTHRMMSDMLGDVCRVLERENMFLKEAESFIVESGENARIGDIVVQGAQKETKSVRFRSCLVVKLLGIFIDGKASTGTMVENAKSKAEKSLAMRLKGQKSSRKTIVSVYHTYVRRILTYGCELWVLQGGS